MRQDIANATNKFITWGIVTILVLMPFHAFLSVFLGSIGLSQFLIQSWKESLILIMGIAWFAYSLVRNKLPIKLDSVNIIFLLIIGFSLLVTLIINPGSQAVLFGIKTNLVALALFFIAQIPISKSSFLKRNLKWLVIIPAIAVAVLAILQGTLIPPDWLAKLGYSANTINPKQIVDGSLGLFRAFSTLGGPNQLGAYLILPLVFVLTYAIREKNPYLGTLALPIYAAILLSFSRSAWIGSVIATFICIAISLNKKYRLVFLATSLAVVSLATIILFNLSSTNQKLQNVLLHGRYYENQLQGSDSQRLDSISSAINAIRQEPLGHGLGSAGPASYQSSTPVISENWYLQIAYEVGILGLILYIFGFTAILGEFFRDRKNPLATALFSATVAILVVSLFLHAWTDSTLVLITFALYGLYRGKTT